MSDTYSQIHIQIVFAVQHRLNLIDESWREELNKYISGIISNKSQKSLIVNGARDDIHVLVGLRPFMALADLVRDIKCNSTNFINDKKFLKHPFSWQDGYGAFSYSKNDIGRVYDYILHQKEHHQRKSFREEYIGLLNEHEIEFNEQYLFKWIDIGR